MDSEAVKDIVSVGNQVVPATRLTCGNNVWLMELSAVPSSYATPSASLL
jgi:hypothetical protein